MSCGPGKVAMAFDVANPEAVAWAERNAARLVADVTKSAQEAIRTVVSAGIENGVPPNQTAKLIRSSIGLTERDAQAVMNRHLKLLSEGVDSAKATARAEKYASKLLRKRAETIAINETLMAAGEGQRQLWEQAKGAGLMDSSQKKTLLQADPCPICTQAAGEVVFIDQEFSIGTPPFHVRCRCEEVLI